MVISQSHAVPGVDQKPRSAFRQHMKLVEGLFRVSGPESKPEMVMVCSPQASSQLTKNGGS
jgi:hypothetical protein